MRVTARLIGALWLAALAVIGGSAYLQVLDDRHRLTQDLENEALDYIDRIDRMGGMVDAIERGFPQKEIAEAAYRFQQAVERGEKVIVGVNDFVVGGEKSVDTLYIDQSVGDRQAAALERLKASRDDRRVAQALDRLRAAARSTENVMPPVLAAVRAYATVGEMCDALREVWGEHQEVAVI